MRSGGAIVREAVALTVGRLALRHRLLLVTDGSGWIIERVARSIRANVPPTFRARVVQHEWTHARRSVLHFVNRSWAWADGVLAGAHPSNRVIGLWWHGRLDSKDPEMQEALARVGREHAAFARMQVTCSIGRQTMLAVGVPEEKIVVLPEGVDLRKFHPARSGQREEMRRKLGVPPEAIAVGCFQKDGNGWDDGTEPKLIKGPDVFVRAIALLSEHWPVHVVIPGPARGFVRAGLDRAGVSYSAPGHVPDDELTRCYHALDLYVSPSRDEGGPAGVLESMASGVAVVSSRTGMAPDMIEDGKNGRLTGIGDADAIADAAGDLIRDGALRERIVERALTTIRDYDWAVLGRRYVAELYGPVRAELGA
jgi:glycosyltransferase involved in cell wall biosynthesis